MLAPLAALGVDIGDAASTIPRAGQARMTWDHTPIDLFFSHDRFHEAADRAAVEVPFGDEQIRVLHQPNI
ncbi:MAG: hypothetical protein DYH08_01920 [Actinobacteria bacterium ATB1]|nr:hypothetical protein [Actinobacteria bacterium ATB1]